MRFQNHAFGGDLLETTTHPFIYGPSRCHLREVAPHENGLLAFHGQRGLGESLDPIEVNLLVFAPARDLSHLELTAETLGVCEVEEDSEFIHELVLPEASIEPLAALHIFSEASDY